MRSFAQPLVALLLVLAVTVVTAATSTPATTAAARAADATFGAPQLVRNLEEDPYLSIVPALFDDGGAAIGSVLLRSQLKLMEPGGSFAAPAGRAVVTTGHQLAGTPGGGGVVAWSQHGRTRLAPIARGRLGAEVEIGSGQPHGIWVDERGDVAVAAVVRGDGVLHVAVRPSGRAGVDGWQRFGRASSLQLVPLRTGFAAVWIASRFCGIYAGYCGIAVRAAVSRDGRRFGPVRTLGRLRGAVRRGEPAELRLKRWRGDGALAVWAPRRGAVGVRLAALDPGADRFGAARAISRPGHVARGLEAAANARGDGLIAWSERDGRAPARVLAATVDRRGRVSPSRLMSRPGEAARAPRVRLGAAGDMLVSWSFGPRWWLRTRAAGQRFTAAHELPRTQRQWLNELAVDRDGTALALFRVPDPSGGRLGGPLLSAAWQAGSQPRPRVLDGGLSGDPALALNSRGEALAVWDSAQRPRSELFAAVRRAGGDFGAPTTVSDQRVGSPQALINERGDLLIVTHDLPPGDASHYEIGAVSGRIVR